jgi:hypothetical protein
MAAEKNFNRRLSSDSRRFHFGGLEHLIENSDYFNFDVVYCDGWRSVLGTRLPHDEAILITTPAVRVRVPDAGSTAKRSSPCLSTK